MKQCFEWRCCPAHTSNARKRTTALYSAKTSGSLLSCQRCAAMAQVLGKTDLQMLRDYVTAPGKLGANQADSTVLIHVTHSNLKAEFMEIRLDRHVRTATLPLPAAAAPFKRASGRPALCLASQKILAFTDCERAWIELITRWSRAPGRCCSTHLFRRSLKEHTRLPPCAPRQRQCQPAPPCRPR